MIRSIKQAFGTVVLLAATTALFISGCSSGGGDPAQTTSLQASTLQVGITNSGFTNASTSTGFTNASTSKGGFQAVHLTIDKVVVVPTGKESLADNDPALPVIATFPTGTSVDVLNLHFLPQILGTASAPPGSYSQVRLTLAANSDPSNLNNYVILTSNPTKKLPLTTPGAQVSVLKVIGNFKVGAGAFNTIVLGFNPADAIVVAADSSSASLKPTGISITQVFNSLANAGAVFGTIRSPQFGSWSSATVAVVPRPFSNFTSGTMTGKPFSNFTSGAVTKGMLFSNFSSPGVWKSNFAALLPPNGSALMPSANYRIFVQAYRDTLSTIPVFSLYSSPLFTVTSGQDTPVPPAGTVMLSP